MVFYIQYNVNCTFVCKLLVIMFKGSVILYFKTVFVLIFITESAIFAYSEENYFYSVDHITNGINEKKPLTTTCVIISE